VDANTVIVKVSGKDIATTHIDKALLANIPYFKNQLQTSEVLWLKIRAQVMMLSNVDPPKGLVNGSRGIVTGFVELTREELSAQAIEGDRMAFEKYFAGNHHRNHGEKEKKLRLPQVRFAALSPSAQSGDAQTEDIPPYTVFPVCWSQETTLANGATERLERVQIPLALAWAATVHKAQGMTLDRAAVDIEKSFAPGQAYVALSRCRSPEGLELLGWGGKETLRRAIQCCPIVCRFDAVLRQKWKWSMTPLQATIPEYDDNKDDDDEDDEDNEDVEDEEGEKYDYEDDEDDEGGKYDDEDDEGEKYDDEDDEEGKYDDEESEEEWVEAKEEWEPEAREEWEPEAREKWEPDVVTASPVRKKQRVDYSDLEIGALY